MNGRLQFSHRKRSLVAVAAFALLWARADATPDIAAATDTIDRAISAVGLESSQVGYALLDADGTPILARNADHHFVVASNNKLVTTSAALQVLGPSFTWETSLYVSGDTKGGVLEGDLWVHGTGDPNISGRDHDGDNRFLFRRWADALTARGIREVAGGIKLDATAFDRTYVHPSWPERFLGAWFGAETSALSLADNCIAVQIAAPRQPRKRVGVGLDPPTTYVTVINNCVTTRGRPRGSWGIQRHPLANVVYVSGSVRAGRSPAPVFIPVRVPAVFFGQVLRETLAAAGIAVRGEVSEGEIDHPAPARLQLVDTFTSRLDDSVVITNKRSQNLYAEQILKTMGAVEHGLGTFDNGLRVVRDFLSRCVGIQPIDYTQVDGSGLSYDNRFTPGQLARLLWWIDATPEASALRASLPVAGEDGTLKHRFVSGPLHGRVIAKTGYLKGVSGLSGYLESRGGRVYPFSILINADEMAKPPLAKVEESILQAAYSTLP